MKNRNANSALEHSDRTGQTVLVIGGNGGMSDRYREVVEEHGLSLRHFEKRVPPATRKSAGRVALVVIMIGMVSHSLREQIQSMKPDGAPIVYLRTASVSALRAAVEEYESKAHPAGPAQGVGSGSGSASFPGRGTA
jgi:hypothetical protein